MKWDSAPIKLRRLGRTDYRSVWSQMREFTDRRDALSADEIWLTEHSPVYTLGQAGRLEHLHDAGDTPVVKSDRGGQVTWHGPGQIVVYTLLDLRRARIGIRNLVATLEQATIALLARHGIEATVRPGAPGVYVADAKIAALGLRVRRGCCYHGLALNVNADLSAFARIDPCGYHDLAVTSLEALGVSLEVEEAGEQLARCIADRLDAEIDHEPPFVLAEARA